MHIVKQTSFGLVREDLFILSKMIRTGQNSRSGRVHLIQKKIVVSFLIEGSNHYGRKNPIGKS